MDPTRETGAPPPEPAPRDIIRVETALSRYPAHRLSNKGAIDIHITEPAGDGEVRARWVVSHSSRYGQPGPLAYRLDTLVINRRIEELGRPTPRVIRLGSLSEICRQLGLADSGTNRSNVRRALRQNAFTGISARVRYRQADGRERTLEADFTRYHVVLTGESFPDDAGRRASAVYILLSDVYLQILDGAPTRPLDYEYLKGLSAAPQRFYELLSYAMFAALRRGHGRARLVYSEFCAHAPQVRYFDSNRVHKQMARVHAPHLASGYIRDAQFEATTDGRMRPDWVLHYTPGPRAEAEYAAFAARGGPKVLEAGPAPAPALPEPEPGPGPTGELVRELTARGVTGTTARELVAHYPEERIRRQLAFADDLREADGGRISSLGGYLARSIRDDYAAPPGFEARQERRRREEAAREAARREAEAKRIQQEQDRRERAVQEKVSGYWLGLPTDRQRALDAAALRAAEPDVVETYRKFQQTGNPLAEVLFRTSVRDPHIRRLLGLGPGEALPGTPEG